MWRRLQVLRQNFLLPFGVKALAVTASSQGITSQMVLLGTFSDQVRTSLLQHAHKHMLYTSLIA